MNQIQDYLVRRSIPLDLESGMDSPLYGAGALDSMQLVDLILKCLVQLSPGEKI